MLYHDHLLLKKQSPQQLQDLVNIINLFEEQLKIEIFNFEFAIVLVNISEIEFYFLLWKLQTYVMQNLFLKVQVLKGDCGDELWSTLKNQGFEVLWLKRVGAIEVEGVG